MRDISPPSPAVVVGIDGSTGGVDAALWAIDEAIDCDLPLRLVYAIEPGESREPDCDAVARNFAKAETAVRQAAMAIESVEKPVKIEAEIVHNGSAAALLAASRSAAMVCVGALGIDRAPGARVGSTVSALLARAHCPVAVVRPVGVHPTKPGWIVTEFDESPDGTMVLGRAIDEALLRKAPLHVLTSWRPGFPDVYNAEVSKQGSRDATAHLERALGRYRRLHPEIDIRAVAVVGNPRRYLARHAKSIQLVVLGRESAGEMSELLSRCAHAQPNGANFTVLICQPHVEF